MNKSQINKIEEILSDIPSKKIPLIINFLSWLKDSDDVLTDEEVKTIQDARKEKGGIAWDDIRENV